MAASPQLPRHLSAYLSSLTSRPDVQSTLILSRKDGSIIQTTGLLATRPTLPSTTPVPASIPNPAPATSPTPKQKMTDPGNIAAVDSEDTPRQAQRQLEQQQQQLHQQTPAAPYKPSQAETLAAHIFFFVSSASALSTSLSKPPSSNDDSGNNNEMNYGGSGKMGTARGVNGNGHVRNESGESEGHGQEREEDDELKLLRLRTKVHEILIIPDRKFLLCVVHDLSGPSGAESGAGRGASGGGGFNR
ncbi:uncharacterized protein PADG_02117 [Paracoccidioides brasiliensis Pb18]|uniref:Roadblock/LAMTOR2 domain-containing protein n=1 Tax=Paracoccidioides brasiliensis (strain Pb18) TaxID=502780 RepID=C1G1V1_PARBD|nr:uncharacterized protein PADG_02117 [Paracoccidioides brasiliensis Pb18]EEH45967.1 hypothetical protein PADG_02117 [Paracoccidioides brasiliensis Pb18]